MLWQSGRQRPKALPNVLPCTGQAPKTKNYQAQDASRARAEQPQPNTHRVMSGHGGNAGSPLPLMVSEAQRLYMESSALEKIIRREVTKPFIFLYQLSIHQSLEEVPDMSQWALPQSTGTRSPRDMNVD